MRITALKLATLLILFACNQNENRFDVKSQEFNRKQSHHYSQKFESNDTILVNEVESDIIDDEPSAQIQPINITSDINNSKISGDVGLFSGFFNIFSSSDEKIDSLDKVINECEEKLYTSTDAASSQQSAINSLISERNELLKQLDSLQTKIILSKNTSNRRLVELENDQKKLKSLIEILSREIE